MSKQWKIVPVEPTPEMMSAGMDVSNTRTKYQAMLAAAPVPPAGDAGADWRIDESAGKPILVLNHCSVIESEDAAYVLELIRLDRATSAMPPAGDAGFWGWLDRAYRNGSQGDQPKFTKYNMEVAFAAGISAAEKNVEPVPPAGDVEVAVICGLKGNTLWHYKPEPGVELVDRAHVTRLTAELSSKTYKADLYDEVWALATGLGYMNVTTAIAKLTAERDGLNAQLESFGEDIGQLKSEVSDLEQERDSYQTELTKGRELLTRIRYELSVLPRENWWVHLAIDDLMGATPIAHNVDESCGQDAEAAEGKRYECVGKGGEYQVVAIAQGAGTLKGFNHYVYKNADGVHFVREPDDFLLRMQVKP